MSKKSTIAELGVINILNQMKNPLTNIRLCAEMIEKQYKSNDGTDCHDIIKKNAIVLEQSIRDLLKSFKELGMSIHVEADHTPLN